jgi:hypothetical protein
VANSSHALLTILPSSVAAHECPNPRTSCAPVSERRSTCPPHFLGLRFNKQLKDNWGLETLVSVGESWLPAMLEQDEVGGGKEGGGQGYTCLAVQDFVQ